MFLGETSFDRNLISQAILPVSFAQGEELTSEEEAILHLRGCVIRYIRKELVSLSGSSRLQFLLLCCQYRSYRYISKLELMVFHFSLLLK